MAVESEFDQWAVSSKGARGLMQLMPATARRLGVSDSFDARQNIFGGTQYLRILLDQFGGDVALALAAYNAGPNAVLRYGGIPPYRETRGYVQKVQAQLGAGFAAPAPSSNAAAFYVPSDDAAPGGPVRAGRPAAPQGGAGASPHLLPLARRAGPHPRRRGAPAGGDRLLDGSRPRLAMADPIPRGPFDQGLFLAHYNKGREHFEARRLEEAERQLEEAYLLRPRDPRVLNLLGLVYFRGEKLDKAEEVYRKLIAESPEAHTLHYNLGLICFKLGRLEDAESAFLKALELTQGNPKIHFYLGSIYERLHRYKDAIYQYRQAGANMMVQRLQVRLGPGGAGADSTAPPGAIVASPPRPNGPPEAPPDTKPPGPGPEAAGPGERADRPGQDAPAREPVAHGRGQPARRALRDGALPGVGRHPAAGDPGPARARPAVAPSPAGGAPVPAAFGAGRRPRGVPRSREGPHGGGLLGQGLHQAGHDLLVQRQPDVLGEGQARRRAPGARDRHGNRAADPDRPGAGDHVHAGGGRAGLRRAEPPAGLRGGPAAPLRPPRRRGGGRRGGRPRGAGHGRAVRREQAAAPHREARPARVGAGLVRHHVDGPARPARRGRSRRSTPFSCAPPGPPAGSSGSRARVGSSSSRPPA